MVPTDRGARSNGAPYKSYVPAFEPILYSFDAIIPVVDLQMEKYWFPNDGWVRYYYRFHIAMGWVLSTLAVLGFTGVVRK